MKIEITGHSRPQQIQVEGEWVDLLECMVGSGSGYLVDDLTIAKTLITNYHMWPQKIVESEGDKYDFLILPAWKPFLDKHLTEIFSTISDGGYKFLACHNRTCLFWRDHVDEPVSHTKPHKRALFG